MRPDQVNPGTKVRALADFPPHIPAGTVGIIDHLRSMPFGFSIEWVPRRGSRKRAGKAMSIGLGADALTKLEVITDGEFRRGLYGTTVHHQEQTSLPFSSVGE